MIFEIIIPHLGATGGDVQIVEWLAREGEFVRAGSPLFVVETDKATEDVQAFRDGYLRQILAPAGSEREPGAIVALLTDTADESIDGSSPAPEPPNAAPASSPTPSSPPRIKPTPSALDNGGPSARPDVIPASPRARRLAKEHGIDLATVTSSSADGVIQATDVTAAVERLAERPATNSGAQSPRQRAFAQRNLRGTSVSQPTANTSTDGPRSQSWMLDAFRKMVLIRRYEEHLYHLFLQGKVPGTLHQCQGQEAVAVGVCSALRNDDFVFSTHRPVGHLIAKGASLNALTAEIWGKATGCVGGKGGQMHLADFSVGAMVSNAIVGANIPIATGAAMAFRMQGLDRVAVSFFGDGASNIGAFHEGLNLAAVQDAPVVFVCENNLYAASTHISATMRITDIADRAKSYGMPGLVVDGMDLTAVFEAASEAVLRARTGKGPTLLECKTYRYRGHSRGDPCGYRDEEEFRTWSERDPLEVCRRQLRSSFGLDDQRLTEIEQQCQAEVEAAVAYALASPDPLPSACLEHVFAEREVIA